MGLHMQWLIVGTEAALVIDIGQYRQQGEVECTSINEEHRIS